MTRDTIIDTLSIGETVAIDHSDPRVRGLSELMREMGEAPPDKDAPTREVIARLGDNWSPLILKILETGSYRHATLKRLVGMLSAEGDISQRMLTLRLKALERDGFVLRRVDGSIPPRVTYSLSEMGLGLTEQLNHLLKWIDGHSAQIETARRAFTSSR